MSCEKYLNKKIADKKENIDIAKIAKDTIAFMAKHHIPITPKNYEDWFFVFCKAIKENHLLTDQNLILLYEEYIKDKPIFLTDFEVKEVAKELKDIANESEEIISSLDENMEKYKEYIEDSKNLIDKSVVDEVKKLYKRVDDLEEENRKLKEKIENDIKKIDSLQDRFLKYKKLSLIDPLTETFNRRAFFVELEDLKNRTKNIYLIYLDIDDFKQINDKYGHNIGDMVLKDVAEILKNYTRKDTKIFRIGGEEFGIILTDIDRYTVLNIAERIRKVMENHNIRLEKDIISFTASFGIAQLKDDESIKEFIDRADKAMYEAKKGGKNRVIFL